MIKKIFIILIFLYCCIQSDTIGRYDRDVFTGPSAWLDADRDCQNTRAEVLIREHLGWSSIKFVGQKKCVVDSGRWFDPYTGIVINDANNLDIDHMVSLKDAWLSGASKWDRKLMLKFANNLDDEDHLIAVYKIANRAKGSKGPDEWLPGNKKFVKEYCRKYIRVKLKWDLTITEDQLKVLQDILGDENITYPKIRK